MEVAEKYQSQLARIKTNVEKSHDYWKPNADRFTHYRNFVLDTSLDATNIALLKTLKKPQIEFNILEAYISRLLGEFSKQEPSIEVMAGDEEPVQVEVINAVQGHIKHTLCEANKDGFEYNIFQDMLTGGYSVAKVYTDYANEMSFNQVIKWERVYDPLLCGFDPMARLRHKGDGEYCFELFPKTKAAFEEEYPDIDIKNIKFAREQEGFSWSYKTGNEDTLLICDYYEKKKKKVKIVQVVGQPKPMKYDEYKKLLEDWNEASLMEAPPVMVGEPRWTEIITIVRYRFIGTKVIEYVETDHKKLPLVFFDGNSFLKRHEVTSVVQQMTRPYVYQAQGIQQLKNFAGQTLANEFENMIQHKFKVAKEALPNEEDYLEAYRNVQQADVLVYNHIDPNHPEVSLPPPMEVNRIPIPPELNATFVGADQMTQVILGNFDMDIGKMNQSQVSGIAVQESITQSNAASMPFIVGFLQGLTRMAEITLDLIPKYYLTPRTMPIVRIDGKKDFVMVNQPQGVSMKYGENALNVKVEAGVNFSVQKSKAFNTLIALQQANPKFAQFMADRGLKFLLKNVEMKGIDELEMSVDEWAQQQEEMQQQQQQMAMQQQQQMMMNNPQIMRAQNEAKKSEMDMIMKAEELKMKHADAILRHDATIAKTHAEVEKARLDHVAKAHERNIKIHDMNARHHHDNHKLNHELNKPEERA